MLEATIKGRVSLDKVAMEVVKLYRRCLIAVENKFLRFQQTNDLCTNQFSSNLQNVMKSLMSTQRDSIPPVFYFEFSLGQFPLWHYTIILFSIDDVPLPQLKGVS